MKPKIITASPVIVAAIPARNWFVRLNLRPLADIVVAVVVAVVVTDVVDVEDETENVAPAVGQPPPLLVLQLDAPAVVGSA